MAKDKCIICNKDTTYDFNTHIDMRYGYIEGAGQLCVNCYKEDLYSNTKDHYKVEVTVSEDMVLNTPNDQDLGSKIRNLYWKIKNR